MQDERQADKVRDMRVSIHPFSLCNWMEGQHGRDRAGSAEGQSHSMSWVRRLPRFARNDVVTP